MKFPAKSSIVSAIVMLGGLTVTAGWVLDIPVLKSILPFWVTMKFSTAVCFVFTGLLLFFVAHAKKYPDAALLVLPVASLVILLFMASFLAASCLKISLGIEDLFVREAAGAVKTTEPGIPSVATMINFVLIALSGITVMLRFPRETLILNGIGAAVALIGGTAVLGYLLNQPSLYFAFAGRSSAMAFHTSILFVLTGWGLCVSTRS